MILKRRSKHLTNIVHGETMITAYLDVPKVPFPSAEKIVEWWRMHCREEEPKIIGESLEDFGFLKEWLVKFAITHDAMTAMFA